MSPFVKPSTIVNFVIYVTKMMPHERPMSKLLIRGTVKCINGDIRMKISLDGVGWWVKKNLTKGHWLIID